MPRKRLPKNQGLPARWRHYHGAYYYLVPPGLEAKWDGKKQFRLGTTLPEAHRTWAVRLELFIDAKLIGELLDRYALDVVPLKAPKTQKDNLAGIKRLKEVFGNTPIRDFKPIFAYQYRDRRGKQAPTAANRELEVLSHAFTKAIEWGYREDHPMTENKYRKLPTKPRTRYVEDWEIVEALSLQSRHKKGSVHMVNAYIKTKLLTGQRRGDLLRLKTSDLKEDGIHITPQKTAKSTGKQIIIEWTPALRRAINEALTARPVHISPWVFCTRRGKCYIAADGTASSWDSLWQRFMERVLKETKVKIRFTEHDLRAKCASDAQTLEHAQALLVHADSSTTKRIYRRRPDRIKPLH